MTIPLKTKLGIVWLIFFVLASLSLVNCGSSSADDEDSDADFPSVAMVIYAIENAGDSDTMVSATAYSLDNFTDTDIENLSLTVVLQYGLTGMMNYGEFHIDKSLEAWVDLDGEVDRSEILISSIAATGAAYFINELTNIWSVKRVSPGELYHFDFTDDDDRFFTGSMPSEEFVGITNYTDGDSIDGDTLTVEWDQNLVQGDLSLHINYTDAITGETVSELFEEIPNIGAYSVDISRAEGNITLDFYHSVEQPDAEEFGPRFVMILAQRTTLTLSH